MNIGNAPSFQSQRWPGSRTRNHGHARQACRSADTRSFYVEISDFVSHFKQARNLRHRRDRDALVPFRARGWTGPALRPIHRWFQAGQRATPLPGPGSRAPHRHSAEPSRALTGLRPLVAGALPAASQCGVLSNSLTRIRSTGGLPDRPVPACTGANAPICLAEVSSTSIPTSLTVTPTTAWERR